MTPAVAGSIASPPNVNVIPHATLTARKGPFSRGSAQFDFGRSSLTLLDCVDTPSFTAGSHRTPDCSAPNARAASLYRPIVSTNASVSSRPFSESFAASSSMLSAQIFSTTSSAYSSFRSQDTTVLSYTWKA
ncbi:hypothetical protein GSI_15624 [Ganoderma sinense ZZ0214-1]|uniref:Uncharacterized protein n=1 Tax=Ganoderma sinense ZZ0214-1 TaxID=1077348 RepID=A0A2G8RNN4_9APHY|nr:hypothetical protein GSI_15624 [Ganoderma sinense ZZ0214-1]